MWYIIEYGASVAQHFLLSTAARTLSLATVARMSDDEARARFAAIRWSDNAGRPYCPKCGCLEICSYACRPIYKCKGCNAQFSVTSGTIFANRKLSIRDYLLAIAIFVNGAKGYAALQLSRDLDCQYKTAFVLSHKIREAMASDARVRTIGGKGKIVDVDGAYFGVSHKPENKAEDRKDRRSIEERTGKRKVLVVMRERGGRTLPFVVRKESDGVQIVRERVESGTVLHADEATGWDRLYASYEMKRVNHSIAYSQDGIDTNQAESFFSRMRRAEIGVHHRINKHLTAYASEMAWREDHCRISTGEQHEIVATLAMRLPPSREWAGYWQRSRA